MSLYLNKIKSNVRLVKKAFVYLWVTKSWSAFGIRVLSRISPERDHGIPFILRIIFPTSSLWLQLDRAIQSSNLRETDQILGLLLRRKKIFLNASTPEINLKALESKVYALGIPRSRIFFERRLIHDCVDTSARLALDAFYFSKVPVLGVFKTAKTFYSINKLETLWKTQPLSEGESFVHKSKPPLEIGIKLGPELTRQVDGLKMWLLENVNVVQGCQIFNDTSYFWYEFAADPKSSFVAGYYGSKPLVRQFDNQHICKMDLENWTTVEVESGFLLAGRCSNNYFHWLIEYLPRILSFQVDALKTFDGSIIIEKGLPVQIIESLSFCLAKLKIKNPLLQVDFSLEILKCKKLYVLNTPTIIHDDIDAFSYAESAYMNIPWLQAYVKLFQSKTMMVQTLSPKLVYLTRTNFSRRKLTNEPEISEYLTKKGFVSVYPENLSFEEQIEVFANADVIVAQSGAALSNIIFCKKNCVVIALVARETRDFSVFSNLSAISGCSYYICTGPLLRKRSDFSSNLNWHFSEFSVPLTTISQTLETALK